MTALHLATERRLTVPERTPRPRAHHNLYIERRYCLSMSQNLDEMLTAWEASCSKPNTTPLPQRFFDVRKRATPRRRVSKSALTPEGEAALARELGLDEKNADPPSLAHLDVYAWVPDGEPGSYKGSREAYMPLD